MWILYSKLMGSAIGPFKTQQEAEDYRDEFLSGEDYLSCEMLRPRNY